jgi:hypothetical protein
MKVPLAKNAIMPGKSSTSGGDIPKELFPYSIPEKFYH